MTPNFRWETPPNRREQVMIKTVVGYDLIDYYPKYNHNNPLREQTHTVTDQTPPTNLIQITE